MKIALVRYKYTPYGGAERYMARLIDGLVAAGHEVHVFAAQWDATGVGPVQVHRVPVVSCALIGRINSADKIVKLKTK